LGWNLFHRHRESDKEILIRAEMTEISSLLDEYHGFHDNYPKIAPHEDSQDNIHCSAVYVYIDPNGQSPDLGEKIDLIRTPLKEINRKFIDAF
jgi:hypothetical protein